MTPLRRNFLICAAVLAAVALCTWWWFSTMEKKWIAVPHYSDAVRENRMLAATRLLKQHGHAVDVSDTLGEALLHSIPDGTIVLEDNNGIMTRGQADELLEWTRKGNTLIARPKWSNRTSYVSCDGQDISSKTSEKNVSRDVAEADPLGNRFGVELVSMRRYREEKDEKGEKKSEPLACVKPPPPCMARFTPPGKSYPLELDVDDIALESRNQAPTSALANNGAAGVRVYDEGKGHVVFVADNYFDNNNFGLNDDAELLLDLASLNHNAKHVLLVQRLDVLAWWELLWSYFRYGVVSLGVALILLLWIALRRFGPVLPEPDKERRSLIEHVDASGRWLWQASGGRASLLDAARNAVSKTLHRRVPDLLRMRPQDRLHRLAQDTGLTQEAIDAALNQPASKLPAEFTHQIQTLQQLGKHYER